MSKTYEALMEELYSDPDFLLDLQEYEMRQASERMEEEANLNNPYHE